MKFAAAMNNTEWACIDKSLYIGNICIFMCFETFCLMRLNVMYTIRHGLSTTR